MLVPLRPPRHWTISRPIFRDNATEWRCHSTPWWARPLLDLSASRVDNLPPPQPLSEGCATHDAAKAMANSTATGCQACGLPAPSPLLWCPRLGPNGSQGGVAGRPRGVGQVEHHGGAQGPGPPTPSLERTSTEPQGEEEGASRTSYTIVGLSAPVFHFRFPFLKSLTDLSISERLSLFLLSYIKNQQGCVKLRLLFDFFLWRPDHCVGRGWIGYDEGVGRPRMGYRSGR